MFRKPFHIFEISMRYIYLANGKMLDKRVKDGTARLFTQKIASDENNIMKDTQGVQDIFLLTTKFHSNSKT